MPSSLESQPLPKVSDKVEVTCPGCNARYRVPGKKAGKRVRCRKCRAKISVPSRDISMRTRNVILDELGITHDDQPAYVPPTKADDEIDAAALFGMDHEPDDEASDDESGKKKKKKRELESWVRREDPSKAKVKAGSIAGLVLLGGLGFARSVLFLGWPAAVAVAVVLAAVAFKVASDAYAQAEHVPSKEGAPA